MSSCVDKISLPETTTPAKIHVECELSPPFHIKAKLSTTGDLNGGYLPTFPEDATIRLYSQLDEEFTFTYNPDNQLYEVTNGRLRGDIKYTLSASVKDTSITSVYASTKIPLRGQLDSIEVINMESLNNDAGDKEDFVTLKINLLKPKNQYFRVYFDARYAKIIGSTNPEQLMYNTQLMSSEIESVVKGGTGVHDAPYC